MSVTFDLANPGPVKALELRFWCDTELLVLGADVAAAKAVAAEHSVGCDECTAYNGPLISERFATQSINMSNGNAVGVLDLLGYTDESMYGECDAQDFLGRVLMAIAVAPADEGRPTFQDGNILFGGTEPGYKQNRLRQLYDLALSATKSGTSVVWG